MRIKLFLLLPIFISLLIISIDEKSIKKNQKIYKKIDYNILKNGDLIFKKCTYIDSEAVNLLDKNGDYSHVGIIIKNDKKILVIDSEPEKGVIIESIKNFLNDAYSFSIFRLKVNRKIPYSAVKFAKKFLNLPFDNNFDLKTDNKLYCTELVWKSFLKAGFNLTGGKFNHFNFIFFKNKSYILPSLLLSSKKVKKIY